MGRSESTGAISPNSDLNGAPNRRKAVGEFSSAISLLTCRLISSRFRSVDGQLRSKIERKSDATDSALVFQSGSVLAAVRAAGC